MLARFTMIGVVLANLAALAPAQLPPVTQLPAFPPSGGIELRGGPNADTTASRVIDAGDLNGDGVHDLAIGCSEMQFGTATRVGGVYVVFGSAALAGSPPLDLSQLDGTNGYLIRGVDSGDRAGWTVAAAGDVNGDGMDDLAIGAPGACVGPFSQTGNTKGVVYVVFGAPGNGASGVLFLDSLNGWNGFQIEGCEYGDAAGDAVDGIGDVNADGFDDLLIGAQHAGAFAPTYVIDTDTWETAAGDIDGDGDQDLLVTSPGVDKVTTLRNDGRGLFTPVSQVVPQDPTDIFLPDLDGDGDLDLVLGNVAWPNGCVTVCLNPGNGVFDPPVHYTLPNIRVRVAVADLDGDGDLDVAATDYDPSTSTNGGHEFRTLLNDGSGHFTLSAPQAIGRYPAQLLACDFDSDGDPDIAFFEQTTTELNLWKNVGGGQFVAQSSLPSGFLSQLIATDFDQDGDPDIVSAQGPKRFTNLGALTFAGPQPLAAHGTPSWIAAGDLDGDGHEDLAAAGDQFDVFFNRGGNSFSVPSSCVVNAVKVGSVTLVDFDGDGDLDVFAAASAAGQGKVTLLTNNGDGTFPSLLRGEAYVVFGGATKVEDGVLSLLQLAGNNGFRMPGHASYDMLGTAVAGCGDLDQDGIDDFAVGAPGNGRLAVEGGAVFVVRGAQGLGIDGIIDLEHMSGATGFALAGDWESLIVGQTLAGGGDLNGDHVPDLATGSPSRSMGGNQNTGAFTVLFGAPGLGASAIVPVNTLIGTDGFSCFGTLNQGGLGASLALGGDVNGDGLGDLLVGETGHNQPASNAGAAYVMYGHPGVGLFGLVTLAPLDGVNRCIVRGPSQSDLAGASVAFVSDLDHDGKDELLIGVPREQDGNVFGKAYLLRGSGVPTPANYCTAKVNSLGCIPLIDWAGLPTPASGQPFLVTASMIRNNKPGLLLYGTHGPQTLPFQGGTLCVAPPVRRTHGQFSNGTPIGVNDCTGTFAFDFNAFVSSSPSGMFTPGSLICAQYWSRDPGFPAPNNSSLTDALQFTLGF